MTPFEHQARAILDQLAFKPFENCLAMTHESDDLPPYNARIPMESYRCKHPLNKPMSNADGEAILARLPERIRVAFNERASELDYPVEAVLEIALAGYLDQSAIAVVDCKPKRGKRVA